jgi:voltage-dependent calcium channel T type alpha-1G
LERWDEVRRPSECNIESGGEDKSKKRRRDSLSTSSSEGKEPPTPNRFRRAVKSFANSNHFTRGILVAILINTISMGIEHHQQPEILTVTLDYTNYFFTGLFAFEMLLKIISDGVFGYLSDGFNTFDGAIVVLR